MIDVVFVLESDVFKPIVKPTINPITNKIPIITEIIINILKKFMLNEKNHQIIYIHLTFYFY